MDLKLDRKILISTDIEHKSLYSWCLQEEDKNGEKVGSDQIPWEWSNRFIAKKLSYSLRLGGQLENTSRFDDATSILKKARTRAQNKLTTTETECIYASLSSDGNKTTYSMFGTDRIIDDINLSIYIGDEESCNVYGYPSYESEIDFRYIEQPDTLYFSIFLTPDKFNKIVELIKLNNINHLYLRLTGVRGFYSPWSPSISTSNIKVLCQDSDHSAQISEICELTSAQVKNIPRLGEVFEYELDVIQKQDEAIVIAQEPLDDVFDGLNEIINSGKDTSNINFIQIQRLIHQLKQSLVVIVILLIFILIFK